MNQNNIDGILHPNPNHDGGSVEKKEQPKPITGWVVDDDKGICDFLMENTADVKGLSLKPFSSSGEVLDALKSNIPDFLILDGNLGEESADGCELTEQIKKMFADNKRPVVFAFTNDPDKRRLMLEKGADLSLDKTDLAQACENLSDVEELKNTLEKIKAKRNANKI